MSSNKNTLIIVVDGVIGAGKTSAIKIFEEKCDTDQRIKFLYESNFNSLQLMGTSYNPLEETYSKRVNNVANIICSQIHISRLESQRLSEAIESPDLDVVICDRCFLSCNYFIETLFASGSIDEFVRDFVLQMVKDEHSNIWTKDKVGCYSYVVLVLDPPLQECYNRTVMRGRWEEMLLVKDDWMELNNRLRNSILKEERSNKIILHNQEKLITFMEDLIQNANLRDLYTLPISQVYR